MILANNWQTNKITPHTKAVSKSDIDQMLSQYLEIDKETQNHHNDN